MRVVLVTELDEFEIIEFISMTRFGVQALQNEGLLTTVGLIFFTVNIGFNEFCFAFVLIG